MRSRYSEPSAHLEDSQSEPTHKAQGESKINEDADDWVDLARQAFRGSTDYVQANLRVQWERNLHSFRSEHAPGSKYHSETYKHRSRLFRPKPRAAVRANEAAFAATYFSTANVINIQPENDSEPLQVQAAKLMHELVNYRLTHTIPWFQVSLGACQDAQVMGVACSHQYWDYREREKWSAFNPSILSPVNCCSTRASSPLWRQ